MLIFVQNSRSFTRGCDGAPGDRIGARPVTSFIQFDGLPTTPSDQVLLPPVEPSEFFTNEIITDLLAKSLETAALTAEGFVDVGVGPGSDAAASIDWLTISDQAGAVVDDVTRIANHPLVPAGIPIYGYVYDVRTGQLVEVPAATEAGRPRG